MAQGKDKNKTNKSDNKSELSAEQKTAQASVEIEQLEAELKATAKLEEKAALKEKAEPSVAVSAEPTSPPTDDKSDKKQSPQNQKSFSWLAFFAFIFSLVAITAAGYLWWQAQIFTQTQKQDLEQTQTLAEQSYQQTRNTLKTVQDNLAQLQLNQQRGNDFVLNTQRSLQSLNNRIKELGQSQPNTWLAAESLYLVNLAEHRLLIEKDSATAVQLLLSANVRLAAMQDPSVFYLRTAISEDIATLNAVVQPDTESAFLALSGVISQMQTLPLARKYTPEPIAESTKPEVSSDISDWKTNLANSMERFMGNFVTITRRDTPIEPELPPKQRWYVRANVTSQLLAAQNASLNNKQTIYRTSIAQASAWLQQYFDLSDPAVTSVITTLDAIKDKKVEISLPQGLTAQPLLKTYVAKQMNLQMVEGENQ